MRSACALHLPTNRLTHAAVSLAAVIAALQLFVSQHPAGGAACMLLPANNATITRNDIRAIARAEVQDDEVVIVMGEPIPISWRTLEAIDCDSRRLEEGRRAPLGRCPRPDPEDGNRHGP